MGEKYFYGGRELRSQDLQKVCTSTIGLGAKSSKYFFDRSIKNRTTKKKVDCRLLNSTLIYYSTLEEGWVKKENIYLSYKAPADMHSSCGFDGEEYKYKRECDLYSLLISLYNESIQSNNNKKELKYLYWKGCESRNVEGELIDKKIHFYFLTDDDLKNLSSTKKEISKAISAIDKKQEESDAGQDSQDSGSDAERKPFNIYQKIYYGAPGTGKSYQLKLDTKDIICNRVTFHPEYDYAQFVGCYKPFTVDKTITYQFFPQSFLRIYLNAWMNPGKQYCLVIDEINRGNCAQIFGDIFQLLDRDQSGFSKYYLSSDADIDKYIRENPNIDTEQYMQYISKHYEDLNNEMENYTKDNSTYMLPLALPSNLDIRATMNTSDQSLYPMDSAFKRRWNWEYIPIDYTDVEDVSLVLCGEKYVWKSVLNAVNKLIYNVTHSEDKQLGNRFIDFGNSTDIDERTFVNKVLFYLWTEIYKDFDSDDSENDNIFGNNKFSDLFEIVKKENGKKEIKIISADVKTIVDNILKNAETVSIADDKVDNGQ